MYESVGLDMTTSFWVFARGLWRRLELPSGRVAGWSGRARFCFVRDGRVQAARSAAVLRGLRALQAGQPTTVRDGVPLSKRRWRRVKRAPSPRCCCRAAADARNALVQLNLTALQQTAPIPGKADASVQADGLPQSEQTGGGAIIGAVVARARGPEPPPLAKVSRAHHSDNSEASVRHCKELIVNEEDVVALRRFLENDQSGIFSVDLHRFDADDEYKSALFYRINPLVCAERDARIAAMLRQQHDEQAMLRAFAGSLGLRAVSELRAKTRYRMRPRARSSDKENHAARADSSPNRLRNKSSNSSPNRTGNKSTNLSPNRSRNKSTNSSPNGMRNKSTNSARKVRRVAHSSDSSDSESDFQPRSLASRHKKLSYQRNTRSKFAQIRSKYEKTKSERDDDVRSKYLVTPRHAEVKDIEREVNSESDDKSESDARAKRTGKNDLQVSRPKDTQTHSISKDKERNNQIQVEVHHKPTQRQRNDPILKDNRNSTDRSPSESDRRKRLRPRDDSHSPSIISRNLRTAQRQPVGDTSEDSGSVDLTYRNSRLRDRRGNFGNRRFSRSERHRSDRMKVNTNTKNADMSKDEKEIDSDVPPSATSKDRRMNSESSKENHSASKSVTATDRRKETHSKSRSPSKTSSKSRGIKRKDRNEIDSDSEIQWADRNGASKDDRREERAQSVDEGRGQHGGKRPRRSTANTDSVFPPQRREYSSLEDHAIVQWVSLGSRASRVNGNALWRELQEQFARIAGRSRSWHSLRNRYLRSILPALGALALPPARVSALRAAQAKGEIKSRRRAPAPNPLLAQPAVRSAWGARPRPRRPADDTHDTQDTLVPATSESEPTQRTLRSSTTHAESPQKRTTRAEAPHSSKPQSSKKVTASSSKEQPSPTYSEVTRRFGAGHAASTPELRPRDAAPRDKQPQSTAPRDASPHKRIRKLFNPKMVM